MDNKKLIDKYDLIEEQLKDEARSLKFIKNLAKKLISKRKLIDKETNIINPERKQLNTLSEEDKDKLVCLYQLRDQYKAHLDMIMVVLNKTDNLIHESAIRRYEEKGLEDKFFIKIINE